MQACDDFCCMLGKYGFLMNIKTRQTNGSFTANGVRSTELQESEQEKDALGYCQRAIGLVLLPFVSLSSDPWQYGGGASKLP